MHLKNDNREIMINDKEDEVIKEFFDSLKNKYQNNFESMVFFDYVNLLHYKYHKIK